MFLPLKIRTSIVALLFGISTIFSFLAILFSKTVFKDAQLDHEDHEDKFSKYFLLRAIQPTLYVISFILSFFLSTLCVEDDTESETDEQQGLKST